MKSFSALILLALGYVVTADYRREAVEQHNRLRAIHDAPEMTLNNEMSEGADQYAHRLFQMFGVNMGLKHSPKDSRRGQGENLAVGCTTARVAEGRSVEDAIKSWYDEVCRYNFNVHRFQSGLGHFSQLVWKDSTELGIGKYTGKQRGKTCTYIVARYRKVGNVETPGGRLFRENVSKGSFRRSYCNNLSDKSVGEAEYISASYDDDDDDEASS
ncbi:Golgi-associated plant pathogenesis-related protein 1-like [Stylophora pistillata]|nr:Golgi-associated plant pathogenesis-related protein 1-like [Stylophora pistillata]